MRYDTTHSLPTTLTAHSHRSGQQALPSVSSPSVLTRLRGLIPTHQELTYPQALRIAELQANRLLELHDLTDEPTPTELITGLPKLRVEYRAMPTSGLSFWDAPHRRWVIQLARGDSWRRQRFSLAHEYKHIIDHGAIDRLYQGTSRTTAAIQAEQTADYFAGCLLVPRRLLKRAWGNGIQRPDQLAQHFLVSEQAIEVRLRQTGLVDSRLRCIDVADVWQTEQADGQQRQRRAMARLLPRRMRPQTNVSTPVTLEELPI